MTRLCRGLILILIPFPNLMILILSRILSRVLILTPGLNWTLLLPRNLSLSLNLSLALIWSQNQNQKLTDHPLQLLWELLQLYH